MSSDRRTMEQRITYPSPSPLAGFASRAGLRLVGLGVFIGFMMSDGTTCERANDPMMAGHMPGGPTNHGTLYTAFRLCRRTRANREQQQRKSSQRSFHVDPLNGETCHRSII
jgi:hypothetical protein